jgi:hypothetical protein
MSYQLYKEKAGMKLRQLEAIHSLSIFVTDVQFQYLSARRKTSPVDKAIVKGINDRRSNASLFWITMLWIL